MRRELKIIKQGRGNFTLKDVQGNELFKDMTMTVSEPLEPEDMLWAKKHKDRNLTGKMIIVKNILDQAEGEATVQVKCLEKVDDLEPGDELVLAGTWRLVEE